MQKYYSLNIFKYIVLAAFTIIVFGNACTRSESPTSENTNVMEVLSSDDNARTYDGKIISYVSRDTVSCNSELEHQVLIENDKLSGAFRVIKTRPDENGQCQRQVFENNSDVVAFEYSQLAAFEGKIHDKVINWGETALDNALTKIVCKLELGPLTLLGSMWTGAVIMETYNTANWNSRLDFSHRSLNNGFMFDSPPPGKLVQTSNHLEFRTDSQSVIVSPGIYQMMHVKIDRPYSEALSPSVNFNKKIFPATIQYFYADYMQSPVFSVSSSAMPSTCFVEEINLNRIQVNLNSTYDFTDELLKVIK